MFQFTKVALDEVRGLALLRSPLPVVAINGREFPDAKAYTLFHEVVHIMLALAHEEEPALKESRSASAWKDVERFAEAAASHVLVPEAALKRMVQTLGLQAASWDLDRVRQLAKKFRLTPLAMATRLRESGLMTWAQYNRWRADWTAYVEKLPPRKGGFATPAAKAVNRAGRPFVQLVLEGLAANRISSADAARYLDLKFQHFNELRTNLLQNPAIGSFDD